jgi:nucleoside-diphosphate-sugar epimerase
MSQKEGRIRRSWWERIKGGDMKVFLRGSGAIGKRLIPLLVSYGHHVVATTRHQTKTNDLRLFGAEPVVVDALDRAAVVDAVVSASPDVVIHQLTALSNFRSLKKLDEELALTNRLRTEGTQFLLEAAQATGPPFYRSEFQVG